MPFTISEFHYARFPQLQKTGLRSGLVRFFAQNTPVDINCQKAEMETAFAIREVIRHPEHYVGQLCAADVVSLEVACYQRQRRGRFRRRASFDRHGAGKGGRH